MVLPFVLVSCKTLTLLSQTVVDELMLVAGVVDLLPCEAGNCSVLFVVLLTSRELIL